MEVENELLKSKAKAIEGKAKALAGKYTALQKAFHSLSSQHSSLLSHRDSQSKEIKRMMGQISEYQKAIEGKDSLLATLQFKLQQKIEEVQLIKDQLAHSDLQLRQFHSAHKESEGTKRKIFEDIEVKKQQVEEELIREREENAKNREMMERRMKELEEQIGEFAASLQSAQDLHSKTANQLQTAQREISRYEKEIHILRNDLRIYKMKAASVLHQKDSEILSLSSPLSSSDPSSSLSLSSAPSSNSSSSSSSPYTAMTADQIRDLIDRLEKENAQMKEEVELMKGRMEELTISMMESDAVANEEKRSLQESLHDLMEDLRKERSHSQLLLSDLHSRSLELNASRDLSDHLEKKLKKEIDEKEKEIDRLKKKIKLTSSPPSDELDERIHQMSETIIQKQTLIDTLSSENSALLIQLQSSRPPSSSSSSFYSKPSKRLADHRYNEEEMMIGDRYVDDDDRDERNKGNERMTSLLTLFPSLASSQSFLSRPFLSVASFVDHLSLQTAAIMRIYPSIRLFALLYLVCSFSNIFSFYLFFLFL